MFFGNVRSEQTERSRTAGHLISEKPPGLFRAKPIYVVGGVLFVVLFVLFFVLVFCVF